MLIIILFFGLFNIGLGFLIGKYPNILSGYNTMSAEKLKNIDLNAIALLYKKGMIAIGAITIVGAVSFYLFNLEQWSLAFLIFPMLIGILIITIFEQKYNHNKQSKFMKYLPVTIIGAILLLSIFLQVMTFIPTKLKITDSEVKFSGEYGLTIQIFKIKNVELLETIPLIKFRTNGSSLGNSRKGKFILDKLGKCHLFLKFPNPPYLYIEMDNGEKIIFNSEESGVAKECYLMIEDKMK